MKKEPKKKLCLLLIGHVTGHPSGSSLLFQNLIGRLREHEHLGLCVINTARAPNRTSNIIINIATALKITLQVMRHGSGCDVITFHASRPAMTSYGPILFLISRFFRCPLVMRLFGGAMEEEFEVFKAWKKFVFKKTVLSAELQLVETKHLVSYFENLGARRVEWFPNSRELIALSRTENKSASGCKRFVFLGRVIEEKGIGVLLEAVSHLSSGISVDVCGPLDGRFTAEQINSAGAGKVKYKGVLSPHQVRDELYHYDALILPTFYKGEGYPGVIIEAYMHGIPVIATDWRAIAEIVDGESGILIPVRSAKALAEAMNRLNADAEFYARLCRGAAEKRQMFSDDFWTEKFLQWCREPAVGKKSDNAVS